MTFPKYPEYKDSGVEWLGKVPAHWTIQPFFSQFAEREESNRGMVEDNLLSLSYGKIVKKNIRTLEGLLPESYETYQLVHPNDIVFRLTDLQNDKRSLRSAKVEEKGIITSAYLAVKPKGIDAIFSHYLFRAYDLIKVFYSMGGGLRQTMKFSDMKWLPVLFPPADEQGVIAAFLDHETARIDALIEEQQRLIELLKEKRQSVISHAVTKGLDPDVPMKDSGAEWLGEAPAHWSVKPLSLCFRAQKGSHGAKLTYSYCAECPDEYPVYSGQTQDEGVLGHIDWFEFDKGENGAILSTTVGAKAMSLSHICGKFSLSQNCMIIAPIEHDLFVRFYYYHLQPIFHHERALIPDHMQASFRMQDLYSLRIAEPPLKEQKAIAAYLDERLSHADALARDVQSSIELMKERRSAIISAAVTGKIDVRDWQGPLAGGAGPAVEQEGAGA